MNMALFVEAISEALTMFRKAFRKEPEAQKVLTLLDRLVSQLERERLADSGAKP